MRTAVRCAALAAVLAGALFAILGRETPGAEAHAVLDQSQPKRGEVLSGPIPEVLLWFSEEIEVQFSHVQVLNSGGERVDNDDLHDHGDRTNPGITMRIDVPNGTYTVVWDVLSAVDGHRTKGSFAYFVGEPDVAPPVDGEGGGGLVSVDLSSGPPRWLEVTVRWLNFAAMALLIGAAAAPFLLLPAGFRALEGGPGGEDAEVDSAALVRLSALGSALLVVVGSGLMLWLQAWSAGDSAASLSAVVDVLTETRYGDIWFVRITLAGVAFLFSILLLRSEEPPWWESVLAARNTVWLALLVVALAIPLTTSLNSHAAAQDSTSLETFVDWIHLVAGGIWVGGLVQLLLAVAFIAPVVSDRAAFQGGLVRRFSLIAIPAVGVIVVTGIVQSIARLGGVSELLDSDYGYTLLAKLLLVLPLVALGAANLLVIGPRILGFARERASQVLARLRRWEWRLRLAVGAEVALAAAVLVATAILTNTPPPREARVREDQGTIITSPVGGRALGNAIADDLDITVWADPGTAGMNEVNVLLTDQNGDWKEVLKVILRFKNLDQDLGETEEEPKPIHPPVHFITATSAMSLPGKWQVEVIVRREGLLDTRAEIPLTISEAPTATPAQAQADTPTPSASTPATP